MHANNNQQHLFICGCARSGTTALWRLLISDKAVGLGNERFIFKTMGTFDLSPKLYAKDRFFNYNPEDTHFKSLLGNRYTKNYYPKLESYYTDCTYVGDKIPRLHLCYDELNNQFPNCKILFIYRNVIDVAQSFLNRKKKQGDSWKRGTKEAVMQWNKSIEKTLEYINKEKGNLLLVPFEELFYGQYDISILMNFLGLDKISVENELLKLRSKRKEYKDYNPIIDGELLSPIQKKKIILNTNLLNFKKMIRAQNVINKKFK